MAGILLLPGPPELLPSFLAVIILLAALLIWTGRYIILGWQNPTPFYQSLMVSAVALFGLIIFPQTGSYTLTFALVPALIFLRYASGSVWFQIIIAASLLMPWLYFMLGQPFDRLIFLLIPLQFIIFQEIVRYINRKQQVIAN